MKLNIVEIKTQADLLNHKNDITDLNIFGVDVETTGLDPYTSKPVLFQIGDENVQYVIHWYKVSIAPLKEFLETSNAIKCFHNHKFDYKIIKHNEGIEIDKNVHDTMLAEILIQGGTTNTRLYSSLSLGGLSEKYLNHKLNKGVRQSFEHWRPSSRITKQQLEYSADDVIVPVLLAKKIQIPKLKELGLEFVNKLESALSCVIGDVELNGMYLDQKLWTELSDLTRIKAKESVEELNSYFKKYCDVDLFGNVIINYDSNIQLLNALNASGIKIEDTEKETLKGIEDKYEIIKTIQSYRTHQKSLSTYGEDFFKYINPVTNRLHSDYWLMVDTGRLSSKNPNLQNVKAPKSDKDLNYREPFKAQNPFDDILTIDYSGCELRVLAQISKDPVMLEAFAEELRTGKEADIHSKVASLMFGVEVSKHVNSDKRKYAKNLNFGLIYGMGVYRLALNLGVPQKEGKEIVKKYFKTMPKVKEYLDRAGQEVLDLGYTKTLSGRTRRFNIPEYGKFINEYEPDASEIKKSGGNVRRAIENKYTATIAHISNCGKNTPIQGTNGDIVKLALIKLRKDIKENRRDVKIINTVHDEIVFEGSDLHDYEPIAKKLMEEAEAYFLPDIPPRVDSTISYCWSK